MNFFAADISDGVGPFLAVYLASNLHWQPGAIGMAIAATQLSMVVGQSPAGFVVDRTRRKRIPIIIASLVVGTTALFWPFLRSLPVVLFCQVVLGLAASFYIPTLVALASALSGKGDFDRTISKNQSYNHAGNVASAVLTGVVARFTNNAGIFYCMMGFAVCCTISALCIASKDVAPPASERQKEGEEKKSLFREVLCNKAFLMFLLLTVVFYFSNGAMLPLVAQEIAKAEPQSSTLYLAACIIIAQLVMVPTVYVCGKLAGKGRKKLLAVAFLLLAARGILYTTTDAVVPLLCLQVLDGMAAGTFSVVAIMVVNDLMGDSDRASFAQGLLAAALSLGSMLSNLVAGFIVDAAGFKIGFVALSGLAIGAQVLLWKGMPETAKATEPG
ncbi:MFS transporter [Sorangium cellulosum]|uniref:MFS transporter n=1 Tax=Sorangium cellulosum TaxID=56 RepID=UPI0013315599|nr:MFS transporter [Sorangium cellulosum]